MSSIEIQCQRVTTESIAENFQTMRGGTPPPLLKVKVHGVHEPSILGVLSHLDPKDIVRTVGASVLLDAVPEGEAKKHYGWD